MPASPDARRKAFAAFIGRCLARAKAAHGWSIPDAAKASGVGVNTLYRWLRSEWADSPEGDRVEAFCDAVEVDPSAAFKILWPGKRGRASVTEPLPMEHDVKTILRKLNSPHVPDAEKYHIRETLAVLAARPDKPVASRSRR